MLAIIKFREGDYNDCLEILTKHPENLECIAMTIHTYLKINRVDLAVKDLKVVKKWADDAAFCQLIETWVAIFTSVYLY
jgi:hypothetical protein